MEGAIKIKNLLDDSVLLPLARGASDEGLWVLGATEPAAETTLGNWELSWHVLCSELSMHALTYPHHHANSRGHYSHTPRETNCVENDMIEALDICNGVP